MTDEKLFEALRNIIAHTNGFSPAVCAILIEFKKAGGQQEQARKVSEKLRMHCAGDEIKEDKVLEILDIIEGFCRPDFKIWN